MLTWNEKDLNGSYSGNCLSKDVASLPITGLEIKNGSSVFVMDTPIAPVTSKLYKFDEEFKIWIAQ